MMRMGDGASGEPSGFPRLWNRPIPPTSHRRSHALQDTQEIVEIAPPASKRTVFKDEERRGWPPMFPRSVCVYGFAENDSSRRD